MPFIVEWWCNSSNQWIQYSVQNPFRYATFEEAETERKDLIKNYDPSKMIGYDPELVRVREIPELFIRPAPDTCCPEMNVINGVCQSCGRGDTYQN